MYKFAILVALAVFTVASAQQPDLHDCRICEFIIAIARHHFHNNITDEGALKTQLLAECGHISNSTDQATCKTIVNNNIDKIYADLKAGDRAGQTCVDINYCSPAETGFPHHSPTAAPKKVRARRQAGTTVSPQQACHLCDRLIAFGEYFLHKNPNATQAQLQAELEHDCTRDPAEQQQCTAFVDANIATIYSDLKAGKRPRQVCTDLGVCAAATSAMPVDNKVRARRQAGTTPTPQQVCHGCDKLIGYGEYFLHKNPNATQAQLQAELEHECSRDAAEQQQCTAFVDANIAKIYTELKAGKRPYQICADLGVCAAPTSAMPFYEKVRARRQAATTESPQHVCHLCDRLIALGEHFLHKNPNATQAQLKAELEHDCTRDPADQQHCTTFVDANIAKIYTELKAGKRPYQVCADLGVCAAPTSAMPVENKVRARRQAATTESPQHVCHLCDRLIALGEHFLHKNPNATQAQLKAELEHDCTRDPADQQHCTTFVDANIAKIYTELKAGKRPYQVCADLGVCAAPTSAMPFFKKLMRNLN